MMAPASKPPTPSDLHFVLVEDDTLLRDLLERAIAARFSPASLRTFSDGSAALSHCLKSPPDLLITDLRLPGAEGPELIRRLSAQRASTRFIALTNNVTPTLPAELIALGVAGFVDKSSPLEQVERAIERVLAGGLYFSANVSPTRPVNPLANTGAAPSVLTDREREIARLVASGLYSKEIGERLGMSPRTVEKERAQIIQKTGTRDLPGLIRWCVRQGLA